VREGLSIVMRDVIMMIESTKKIKNVARFVDCIIAVSTVILVVEVIIV